MDRAGTVLAYRVQEYSKVFVTEDHMSAVAHQTPVSTPQSSSSKDYFVHDKAMCECAIGKDSRVWAHAHVMSRAVVGSGVNIGEQCFVENGAVIGNGCTIKNGVSVWDGVNLEADVFVGPNAVFTNDMMPRTKSINEDYTMVPTLVKRGASIGANATIVCGTVLGEYCMIGAGAVVTKDVPAFALVIGNPGRVYAWVSKRGNKLVFDADGMAKDTDGSRYQLRNNRVECLA